MEGNHWARENQSLGEAGVLVTGPPKCFAKKNVASVSPLVFLTPCASLSRVRMRPCYPYSFIYSFSTFFWWGGLTGSGHPPPRVEDAQVNKQKRALVSALTKHSLMQAADN